MQTSSPGSSTIATGKACHRRAISTQALAFGCADVGRVDHRRRRFLSRFSAIARTRSKASRVTDWSFSSSDDQAAAIVRRDDFRRPEMLRGERCDLPDAGRADQHDEREVGINCRIRRAGIASIHRRSEHGHLRGRSENLVLARRSR